MGIATLSLAWVPVALEAIAARRRVHLQPQHAAVLGIMSGTVWNIGNLSSIIATSRIGLSLAYPIFQCGLFVSGAWGILLFKEMRGRDTLMYCLAGLVLMAGVVMLTAAKEPGEAGDGSSKAGGIAMASR